MSTHYPVLDNRPIDQWKVVELKEELKRRNLTTRGLKDDLIKRLDEAIRNDREPEKEEEAKLKAKDSAREEVGNGFDSEVDPQVKHEDVESKPVETPMVEDPEPHVGHENVETKPVETSMLEDPEPQVRHENVETKPVETPMVEDPEPQIKHEDVEIKPVKTPMAEDIREHGDSETGKFDDDGTTVDVDGSSIKLDQEKVQDEKSMVTGGSNEAGSQPILAGSMENDITDSKSAVTIASGIQESQNDEIQVEEEDPKPPHKDAMLNVSNPNNQVSEVSLGFQVKSDSISTSISINEKNELKDNLNTDNFHIELDKVKPEIVQPSSSDVPHNSGDIHPLDDHKQYENLDSVAERDDNNATEVDVSQKNDNVDGGSTEKLNLDRSSGDDSMEEDVLEMKQVDSNHNFDEVREKSVLTEVHTVKEGSPVSGTGAGLSPDKKDMSGQNISSVTPAEKRKLEGHVVRNSEPPKRQRRWNSESLKVPEPKSSNLTPLTTPKDAFEPTISKRNFTRSYSTLSSGTPKERLVPASQKPPSNSLRIDNFLRPFTLKAAQELLAKTGTVCSFWMDHIKTHCYVTFSSVEEATETRNAVYNLQWPPNGGKLLIADFVDPQEVKIRAEAPTPTPATPSSMVPPEAPSPQPSPRQHVPKQHLPPPPPLPQLPPISDPPGARERLPPPPPPTKHDPPRERLPLPPPPPLSRKPDPPIVTLDDLFRKTRATPRIYYLPLSEEQVVAKLSAQRKTTK